MRNDLIKYALLFFALSGFLASCANAQINPNNEQPKIGFKSNANLSTDEAVIAELQKIIDAKNAELAKADEKLEAKRKAANKLEAKDLCIKRLKEAEVIVIGFFRTDVGCRLDGIFVGSRYFERDKFDLSKIALAALGWEKANRMRRESLAKIWVGEGLLAFSEMSYQTISAAMMNNEVRVIVSSKYPSGITSRSAPKKFVFDENGSLMSASNY